MKTNTSTFSLPLKASSEIAMAIIEQLPYKEFKKVALDVKEQARERAISSLKRLRTSVRKSGLTQKDFEEALKEVRSEK
jgi:hypothetical protein